MDTPTNTPSAAIIRTVALRAFLALIAVNALIAILAILGGAGDDEWRILGSSSLISAASLGVAANSAAMERRRLLWLPAIAAVCACVSAAALIAAIWDIGPDGEGFWKLMGVLATLAIAGTYASVLSLPALRPPWGLAQVAGYACTAALSALTIVTIVFEEGAVEPFGIFGVLLAAATIVSAVGARIAQAGTGVGATSPVLGFCPGCGASLGVDSVTSTGERVCQKCGSGFRVVFTRPELAPPHARW